LFTLRPVPFAAAVHFERSVQRSQASVELGAKDDALRLAGGAGDGQVAHVDLERPPS
jgi:hypothetical protein